MGRAWRYVPFIVWPFSVAIALLWRVPLTIDESRYLTIAWETLTTGDWLRPRLAGVPDAHEPPLLFWLMAMGWRAAGASEWWPRLLPALAGLASWLLLWRLGRRLWRQVEDLPPLAVILTGGTLAWALAGGAIGADLLLTACVLAALLGVARAGAGDGRGWLLFGIGAGLGLLSKGPVAWLHVVPVAVLGPLWSAAARNRPAHWYASLVAGLALGAAILAAWVVPAALAGNPARAGEAIWAQATGRVAASLLPSLPIWWYLPALPLLILPWALWAPAGRALRDGIAPLEPGARFCLTWGLATLAALCLVGEWQPQDLLPWLPAVALLAARGLATSYAMSYRGSRWLALLPWLAAALLLGAGPWVPGDWHGGWLEDLHPAWGIAIGLAVLWAAVPFRCPLGEGAARLHVAAVLGTALAVAGALGSAAGRAYAVGPAAADVGDYQARGVTVAYFGDYQGQVGFAGRLVRPVVPLEGAPSIAQLARDEPGAMVLVESRGNPLVAAPVLPRAVFRYRTGYWSLWSAAVLASHPEVLALIAAPGPPAPDGGPA